jgi:hypothetical protein
VELALASLLRLELLGPVAFEVDRVDQDESEKESVSNFLQIFHRRFF